MTRPPQKRKRTVVLSDDDKKKHHIASEHKRRKAIRDAFTKLVEIVPELEPSDSRSEVLILNKTSEHLNRLYQDHLNLIKLLKSKGIHIDDSLILKDVPIQKSS